MREEFDLLEIFRPLDGFFLADEEDLFPLSPQRVGGGFTILRKRFGGSCCCEGVRLPPKTLEEGTSFWLFLFAFTPGPVINVGLGMLLKSTISAGETGRPCALLAEPRVFKDLAFGVKTGVLGEGTFKVTGAV